MFFEPDRISPAAQDAFASSDNLASRYSALAGDGSQGPKAREAAMLFSAAELSLNEEDSSTALDKAGQAVALFREAGDRNGVADALRLLINAHLEKNQAEAASDIAEKESAAFKQAGDKRGEAAMLLSTAEIGFTSADSKRRDEALDAASQARDLYAELQDTKMQGVAWLTVVNGLVTKGAKQDLRDVLLKALTTGSEALALFRQLKDRNGEAKTLHSLAVTNSYLEDWPAAIKNAKQALAIWRDLGVKRFEGMELRCLGEWHLADGRANDALSSGQAALKLFEEIGNAKGWESATLGTVVRAHCRLLDFEAAQALVKEATRNFQSRADEAGEVACLHLATEVQLAQDNREEATDAADRCLDAIKGLSKRSSADRKFEATVLHTLAQIHLLEKRHNDAKNAVQDAIDIVKKEGDAEQQAVMLQTLSSIHVGLGEQREAVKVVLEARDIFRKSGHKSGHAYSCLACCHAYCARGEFNRAVSMCKEALKIFAGAQRRKGQGEALAMLAEVYLMKGSMEKCTVTAEEGKGIFEDLGEDDRVLESLLITAKARFWAANATGITESSKAALSIDWEKALKAAEAALALARKQDAEEALVAALFGVGQVHVITKRADEAKKIIEEALPLAQRLGDHRAEANLEILTAQMCIVSGKTPTAAEPARRALEIFEEKMEDEDGKEVAAELLRFIEGGGAATLPGADSTAGGEGAIGAYEGPNLEDLVATIQDVALSLMGVESLAGDTPLMDAGLDSLASVEFQNNLQKEFGTMQMPATMVFDYPSVKTMADFIHDGLREAAGFGGPDED